MHTVIATVLVDRTAMIEGWRTTLDYLEGFIGKVAMGTTELVLVAQFYEQVCTYAYACIVYITITA